ncbi:MAG: DUF1402 family protein [Ahrensia sp.]|nr:DUF1402 family protein [Ahrensia sp.]
MIRLLPVFLIFSLLSLGTATAASLVPPGNRNAEQPKIPSGSVKRSKRIGFERKYEKIRDLLARDRKLVSKIKNAAKTFAIDPIHIVGALVGEHTYNVDAKDRLQSYYVKALAYLGQDLSFEHDGEPVEQFIARSQFRTCRQHRLNYDRWTCREHIWDTQFRGKTVDGQPFPNDRFGRVFFQPLYAGQTFGLGQLNPLTALKVNDLVRSKLRREPQLSVRRAPQIYNTIMEPDSTLIYMAAVLRHAIDSYREITGFDISENPGITATLYNLGNVTVRAQSLKERNDKRLAQGQEVQWPQENYYGWLVNEKLEELRSIL